MKKKIIISTMLLALSTTGLCIASVNEKNDSTKSSSVSLSHSNATQYDVKFVNDKGSELKTIKVNEGETPSYGDTSALAPESPIAGYDYTFKTWLPALSPAYADVTYKAAYTATIKKYTVTWYDDDETTVLQTKADVTYGSIPTYSKTLPTKTGYIFKGWKDKDGNTPAKVTDDIDYYAYYEVDPSVQGIDLEIECDINGAYVKVNDSYYTTYTKHYSSQPSGPLVFQLEKQSSYPNYPYQVTVTPAQSDVTYTYDRHTGEFIITSLPSSVKFYFRSTRPFANVIFDYQATDVADMNKAAINCKTTTGVDWGDDSEIQWKSGIITHEYPKDVSKSYTISLYQNSNYSFTNASGESLGIGNENNITSISLLSFDGCSISNYQFAHLKNLTKFNFNKNVTSIGDYAFYDTGLVNINMPQSPTSGYYASIGSNVFASCPNLKTVVIPSTTTTMGENVVSSPAVAYCVSQVKPDGWAANWNGTTSKAPVYWGYQFNEKDANFQYVDYATSTNDDAPQVAVQKYIGSNPTPTIPATHKDKYNVDRPISIIGDSSFKDDTNITSVTFEEGMSSSLTIDDNAFSGCANLTTVDLSKVTFVPKIGANVFNNCTKMNNRSIVVDNSLYVDFVKDSNWIPYKDLIKTPLDVEIKSTNLEITMTGLKAPGQELTFTLKPNSTHLAYELPTSNFTAKVTDSAGDHTVDVTVSNNVGTFKFTPAAETTKVTVAADVFKIVFNSAEGYFDDVTTKKTITQYVQLDATPAAPTNIKRGPDAYNNYTFNNWYPTLEKATADTTYEAQYSAAMKDEFNIRWFISKDATTPLDEETIAKLTMPSHDEVYRPSDTHHYRFIDWRDKLDDSELTYAYKDTDYYAKCEIDDDISINFTGVNVVESGSGKSEFTEQTTFNSSGQSYTFAPVSGDASAIKVGVAYKHSVEGNPTYTWDSSTGALTFTGGIKDDVVITLTSNATLANCSWQEISAISQSGIAANCFAVGDTKDVLVNSQTHQVRVLGFNQDSNANGDKLGISFEFVNTISDENGYAFAVYWNDVADKDTANNDYTHSTVRSVLNGVGGKPINLFKFYGFDHDTDLNLHFSSEYSGRTILSMLPDELTGVLRAPKKWVNIKNDSGQWTETAINDKLFPLTPKEMGYASESRQEKNTFTYSYYNGCTSRSNGKRIKRQVKGSNGSRTTHVFEVLDGESAEDKRSLAGYCVSGSIWGGAYWGRSAVADTTSCNAFLVDNNESGSWSDWQTNKRSAQLAPGFCV